MTPDQPPIDWLDRAAGTPLLEAPLQQLASDLAGGFDLWIAEAVDRSEGEAVQTLCAASLLAGNRPLAGDRLARAIPMFPDPRVLASVLGCLDPQAVQRALVSVLRTEVPTSEQLGPMFVLLAFADLRRTGAIVAQTLELAEWTAQNWPERPLPPSWTALAGLFQDPEFDTLLGPHHQHDTDGLASRVAEVLAACFADPAGFLVQQPLASFDTARSVGRNAPCPCGSGKRFKSCCGTGSDTLDAPAESQTLAARNRLAAERLTALDILDHRLDRLARLPIAHVPEPLRLAWFRRLIAGRAWPALIRALSAVDDPDPWIAEAADHAALMAGPEVTRALIAVAEGRPLNLRLWTRMTLVGDPLEAIDQIEAATAATLDSPPIEAAYALMASPWPHLGLAVARGVLPICSEEQALSLLDELIEQRIQLGHPDWDPIEDALLALVRPNDPEAAEALEAAHHTLVEHQRTIAAIEADQQALQDEVARLKQDAASEDTLTREEGEALRAQLLTMKQALKQRHDERNALRQALRQAQRDTAAAQDEASPATDAYEGDAAPDSTPITWDGQLRLPTFSEAFEASIARVPSGPARSAVQRMGELAAGRPGAFTDCRPLRGLPGLWRAKIGRSYRLLFHLEDARIHAVDLVHRQDLERRLRTLK